MRIAVVINPAAGSLVGRAGLAEEVAAQLAASGLDVEIIPPNAGGLVERLDVALATGADAIVVGGGDGTIAAAAQRLAGTDTALGILPLGTMNMLARDLRIPLDIPSAVAALAEGETRAIDVGEVNGHVFLCASMLGLPARIAHHREHARAEKGLMKWLRVARAAFEHTRRYPPLSFAVQIEGRLKRIRSRFVTVADNAFDENLGPAFTRAHLDRGELVLYYATAATPWSFVKLAASMVLGRWQSHPEVRCHRVGELAITSRRKRIRVMNDGEVLLLAPPLRYSIRPRALKVLVPRAAFVKAGDAVGSGAAGEVRRPAALSDTGGQGARVDAPRTASAA